MTDIEVVIIAADTIANRIDPTQLAALKALEQTLQTVDN